MKSQNIAPCVTQAKEAHLADQTNQPDPGTDNTTQHKGPPSSHPEKGGGQGRQGGSGRTLGSAEPALAPVQVHFGGKSDLIPLKAVMNVSMYKLGGNRPQGLYKGPPTTLTTHNT